MNEKKIWDFFKSAGATDAGAAGMMGNLYAESRLIPTNLQDSYEKKLGHSDESYTAAVDAGTYTNFANDGAGYGIAQWTYPQRKEDFKAAAKAAGKSIGDLDFQLSHLLWELGKSFPKTLNAILTAGTVLEASNVVLLDFERPADQSAAVQSKRAYYGNVYYTKYKGGDAPVVKICIDAGHSGRTYNQSTEVEEYYESEMAWQLQGHLKSALEAKGFQVTTTRWSQSEDPAVYNRGLAAKGCDCFLSLHSNACGTESVDYTAVYRAFDNLNNADGIALELATAIGKLMGNKQAGKTAKRVSENGGNEYYGVMRGARAAKVPLYLLLEHSFHTNRAASFWLLDNNNLIKLAQLEAEILANYYKVTGSNNPTQQAAEPVPESLINYTARVVAPELNIRSGPGTNHEVCGVITDKGVYTITAEAAGPGATLWGKLKSGAGWISLDFCSK